MNEELKVKNKFQLITFLLIILPGIIIFLIKNYLDSENSFLLVLYRIYHSMGDEVQASLYMKVYDFIKVIPLVLIIPILVYFLIYYPTYSKKHNKHIKVNVMITLLYTIFALAAILFNKLMILVGLVLLIIIILLKIILGERLKVFYKLYRPSLVGLSAVIVVLIVLSSLAAFQNIQLMKLPDTIKINQDASLDITEISKICEMRQGTFSCSFNKREILGKYEVSEVQLIISEANYKAHLEGKKFQIQINRNFSYSNTYESFSIEKDNGNYVLTIPASELGPDQPFLRTYNIMHINLKDEEKNNKTDLIDEFYITFTKKVKS